MINDTGKVTDPVIVDSSGGLVFELRAMKHLLKSRYKPATLNAVPVESSHSLRYFFQMNKPVFDASPKFRRMYRKLIRTIEANEKGKATKQLNKMKEYTSLNLYEDAFLNIGLFSYHDKYGSQEEKLLALKRAVGVDEQKKYLPEDTFLLGLSNLFGLLAITKDYQGALDTFERLKLHDLDKKYVPSFQSFVDEMVDLKTNGDAYSLKAKLNANGRWDIDLFKMTFSLHDIEGNIDELKLRCRNKSVFFKALPDSDYHIPKQYGNCNLEVNGSPETTFMVRQLPSIVPSRKKAGQGQD